jgi:chorismate mutase
VEHDVHALQAISRRIHYGAMYVAEGKYRSNTALYADLLGRGDEGALEEALTRPEVEERIYERVARKVESLQAGVNMMVRHRIEPDLVVRFYRQTVIPLTKAGEILYLRARRV